jgi:NAD(P)H-flavin reductase
MPGRSGAFPYKVLSNRAVTPVIRELWLAPHVASLPYAAGQYALLNDAGDEDAPVSHVD